jgi:hypothetical protein
MHSRLRLLLLLPLATLIACGGSTPVIGTVAYTPVSGDYVITVGVGTAGAANFNGSLTVSGTSVSGVFRYANVSACVPVTQDIPFTGTFANSVLTLTSATFSNSVATFTIKLPFSNNSVNQQLASGTSVIAGGTCALASSTLQAQLIPSFNGTWAVTLTSPSNATASLQVTQSAANADGQFPATGTITCAGSGPTALTGLVSGPNLQLATTALGSPIVTANYTAVPATVSACGGSGTMTQ